MIIFCYVVLNYITSAKNVTSFHQKSTQKDAFLQKIILRFPQELLRLELAPLWAGFCATCQRA